MKARHMQIPAGFLMVALSMSLAGCGGGSSGGGGNNKNAFRGTVANPADFAVAAATVFLVPADMIDLTPITASGVLAGTTEGFDEPLEDLIAAAGASFPQTTTDVSGDFKIDPMDPRRGCGRGSRRPGGSARRAAPGRTPRLRVRLG